MKTTPKTMYALLLITALTLMGAGCFRKEPQPQENLDVPFTSQAPGGTWYEPWLNACEETSIYMVDAYYEGDGQISKEEARTRILDIFKTKTDEIDPSLDESMETVRDLINILDLNWKATIKDNPTAEDLVNEISNQRPVIIPVFAPELYGSTYSVAGPDYHVLVLTGYDTETGEFIINDPAYANDKEPRFTFEKLIESIHDLDQNDYDAGRKRVLFTQAK